VTLTIFAVLKKQIMIQALCLLFLVLSFDIARGLFLRKISTNKEL